MKSAREAAKNVEACAWDAVEKSYSAASSCARDYLHPKKSTENHSHVTDLQMAITLATLKNKIKIQLGKMDAARPMNRVGRGRQKYSVLCEGTYQMLKRYSEIIRKWKKRK